MIQICETFTYIGIKKHSKHSVVQIRNFYYLPVSPSFVFITLSLLLSCFIHVSLSPSCFMTLSLSPSCFQHKERETHTISAMLTIPSDPTMRGVSRRPNWPGLAEARKSTRFAQVQISTNSFFQKSPQILGPSLLSMTSFTSPVPYIIRGFYYDICDCQILPLRAWTPALNVCPYPCTKPNSSKPN